MIFDKLKFKPTVEGRVAIPNIFVLVRLKLIIGFVFVIVKLAIIYPTAKRRSL